MVTILGTSNRFISIRWKLLSTYLLLLVIALLIINTLVYQTIKKNYIKEKETHYLAQANIISNRINLSVNDDIYSFNEFQLNNIMGEISRLVRDRVLIVDRNYDVIYDSFNALRRKKLQTPEITSALKGESVAKEYQSQKYGKIMYLSVPINYYGSIVGTVFLSVSLEEVYDEIGDVKNLLLFFSMLTLIGIAIISLFFANVISNPIKQLTIAMQKTAQGKLNEKVEIEKNDEISQLAQAYNLMNTKLSHIEKQRKDFVANVSHELKTPLSSMKLLAESLLIQPDVDVEIYKEFLKDINSEIDRLNEIVESLLNLVDLNEEKLNLNYQLTYVNYLLEKVVNSIRPLADRKGIKVIINQWDKIQIYLDQGKIHQALMNIIHNAIKYTEENGRVIISLYREGNFAVIKIMDNGIGIPQESLPYIFERFYRVDTARSRKTGGTGLGLSISHQIISLHQGEIEVESELNVGTTFYVKLPLNINFQ